MSSELPLSSVCEIVMGQSPSGDDCNSSGEGMPLLNGPSEFGPHHPIPVQYTTDVRKVACTGDLLFCVRGSTTGRMNWADQDYAIGRGLAAIRGKNGYPNSFVRAVIETKLPELLQSATGSTFPNVGKESFAALTLPITELTDAKNAAVVFEALDDRITLLRETNQTLEAIAQAIFKSWFVNFDPVRAKMEGRQPTGMDEETAALFPDELVESELGLIPKGWEVQGLDQIAAFLNGLALQKFPPMGIDDLPVIKIAQLRKGDTTGADKASRAIKPEYIVHDGDVLFSWSGSLEVEIWCGGEGALNQHLFKVTSQKFARWFYFLWTRKHLVHFRQIAASKATTMGHIQRSHLSDAKVVAPSVQVLAIADSIFKPIIDQITANTLEAKTLAELRDTLLPRLISGKLRVPVDETEAVTNED